MKYQGELSIVGACGGYSKTPAKHAPAVGNSVLNSPINNLGSGSLLAKWSGNGTSHIGEKSFFLQTLLLVITRAQAVVLVESTRHLL